MDKATYVFEKYAATGWWKSIVGLGKKELGKSTKYIKKSIKGEVTPLTTMKKTQISNMQDFVKARGPINTGIKQTQLEQTLNKNLWTGGKRPVSVMNKQQLAEAVTRERYLKSMGM